MEKARERVRREAENVRKKRKREGFTPPGPLQEQSHTELQHLDVSVKVCETTTNKRYCTRLPQRSIKMFSFPHMSYLMLMFNIKADATNSLAKRLQK